MHNPSGRKDMNLQNEKKVLGLKKNLIGFSFMEE